MQTSAVLMHDAAVWQDDLSIQNQWFVNGKHYSKTLEAWLHKMDAQKDSIMPVFEAYFTVSLRTRLSYCTHKLVEHAATASTWWQTRRSVIVVHSAGDLW